jgi:hypothetical protein
VLVWAQALQARAAVLAGDPAQVRRSRLIGQVLACLAKLKGPAHDSEDALAVWVDLRRPRVVIDQPEPPQNPIGIGMWALLQLAQLAHTAATAVPLPDEGPALARARSLAQVGLLHPQSAFDQLADDLRQQRN